MRSTTLFLLWVTCLFSSSLAQLLGTPTGCLLNRLDVFPCSIVNPSRTSVAGDNQYAIYSTRIRGSFFPFNLRCIIRSRDDIVRPLDTIGGDPRIFYLFSPGRAQANPQDYGNQQLVVYRVQCEENHFAFFNLTSMDIQDTGCTDPNFPQPRCVDYVRLSRGGGDFGFSETCGATIPSAFTSQLDTGTIEVILRSSDTSRFPGFTATVVCVDNQLLQLQASSANNTGTGGSSMRVQFEARVRRQVEYVHRMRRSAPTQEEAVSLACSVDELNVPFDGGITYIDKVVSIVDRDTMAVIRRLPSPINKLVVMDTNGTQLEFIREAPLSNDSVTVFLGPGPLTRAGVFVFFTSFTSIPDLGGASPEVVIPDEQEADVTGILLAAHTRLQLEQRSELFTEEQLEPPPFDLVALGLADATSAPDMRVTKRAVSHDEGKQRVKRVVESLEAVQCNYTNNILGLAVLNQESINPVLITVIRVIMNCTEREQPGRVREIIESVAIDFQFDQQEYLVKEDQGTVRVCLEIATDGFLPRPIVMSLVTMDGNATASGDYLSVNTTSVFSARTRRGGPGSQMCVMIAIVDDTFVEFDEVFVVTADSPDPNVNTTLVMAIIVIQDDDVMFQLSESPDGFSVSEAAGELAPPITLTLSLGTLPFDVEVLLIDEGTASRNAGDYELSQTLIGSGEPVQSLTFMSGSDPGSTVSVTLEVLEDSLAEEDTESVCVRLSTVPLARLALPPDQDTVKGNITDNDVPMFEFTPRNVTLEESSVTVDFYIELVQSILTFPITMTIRDVTQMSETVGVVLPGNRLATSGEDYESFETTLVFSAESAPGLVLNFSVSILQDDDIENDEVIVIETIVSFPGVFTSNETYAVAIINILDNEADTVLCPALPDPVNGVITYSTSEPAPFQFGTEVQYACDPGFGLEGGDGVRMCLGNATNTVGVWEGVAPMCSAITCTLLDPLMNGTVMYDTNLNGMGTFDFGTEASFSCSAGFSLVGSQTRVCGGNGSSSMGTFDGDSPTCESIECPALTAPTNGQVSYATDMTSPFEIGTVATFTCNAGFSLDGAADTLTCADDDQLDTVGTWSGTEPTCEPIECPALIAPMNGLVSYAADMTSPYEIGTVATYTCNAGFSLDGAADTLTCADDDQLDTVGTWGGTEPTCQPIECLALIAPMNGLVSYAADMTSPYEIGTVATYTCNAGFSLDGAADTLTCADDDQLDTVGTWGGTEPTCEPIVCPMLDDVANGQITYSCQPPFNVGTVALHSCNQGFSLEGDEFRICTGDGSSVTGEWNGTTPECSSITCPPLMDLENGMIFYSPPADQFGNYEFETLALHICDTGFSLIGDLYRMCSEGAGTVGEFDGMATFCEEIRCSELPDPANGTISYDTSPDSDGLFLFGTVATVSCLPGFLQSGDPTRTCVGDGSTTAGEFDGDPTTCVALGAITGSADQELYLVREDGIDVTVQFTVMVTGGVKGDFSLSLQDVNATDEVDYTLINESVTQISPETTVFSYTFNITDDELVELDEVFLVTIFSGPFNASTTVVIMDNDISIFFPLGVPSLTVSESSDSMVTILLETFGLPFPITVHFLSNGSATEGEDFMIDPVHLLDVGGVEGTGNDTELVIVDDSLVERLETVVLLPFSDPIGRLAFRDTDVIQVTIEDDDIPVFNVTPGATSVNESNVTIVNTIELVESILTHSIVFSIDTLSSRVTTGSECLPDVQLPVIPAMFFCPGGTRYCGDGEPASALNCVPIDQYCDGVVNCPNGLDESSCQSCPLGSLPCPSDQGVLCYNSSLSCNGVPDCPSGTDESADICGCPNPGEIPFCQFPNGTSQCVLQTDLCNGVVDCVDGSDENGSLCGFSMCPTGTLSCELGGTSMFCVRFDQLCDGTRDCTTGLNDEDSSICGNCTLGQVRCPNNSSVCVDTGSLCDGTSDCPNGSDEDELICGNVVPADRFSCNDSTSCVLPFERVCDGTRDCPNGRDEESCPAPPCPDTGLNVTRPFPRLIFCPAGTIYCADGGPASSLTCIPIDQFCDGVVNCPNGLDESADFCGNCSLGEIQCPGDPTLTCVNNTLACNGVMDCPNGIDEAPDACGCPMGELPVCRLNDLDSECLSMDRMCDGVQDCVDGTDESLEACGMRAGMTLLCPPGMSQCNGQMCLEFERFCDGVPDCPAGTDESSLACGACDVGTAPCLLDPQNTCVNISATCDGVRDCPNGIDESNLFCRAFRCDSGSDCYIPFDLVCNGFEDCPNGSDEQDCTEMLMFPAGTSPGATISFNTTVTDDSVANGNRLITTTLTVSPPGQFITGENVTMTTLLVVDDEIPPVISVQPANSEIVIGGVASFTVVASGEGLTYQWMLGLQGSVPAPLVDGPGGISGANESTLVLSPPFTNVSSPTGLSLLVVVSNAVGSSASNTVTLLIVGPPVIIDLQPPGQIQVPPGGTAVLTVTASGGTLTYQWFFNDTALSDTLGEISGATESTLTVSNVQQDDVGDYHVRVTNIAGSVDSSSINITLMALGTINVSAVQEVYVVREDGTSVTVQFRVTAMAGGSIVTFTLHLPLTNATNEVDYTLFGQSVSPISPEMTVYSYTFNITDDELVELDEVFLVSIFSGPFSASATVVIMDNDIPVFNVTPGAASVNESNVTIVNTIELVESILTHSIVFSIDTLSSPLTTAPSTGPAPCPDTGLNVTQPFPQLILCPVGTIYCADIGPASSLTCIPIDQFCDGVVNCPNGLDESADFCGNCSLGEIQCPGDPTLTCVNNTFACNGVMDCPNGIDEAPVACGCPMGELPVCRLNDLDSECLSMDRMCDGVQDCVDGTDESLEACGMRAGMTLLCSPGMSQCNGQMCLEFERFCDGVPDCPAGTDESSLACGACAVGTGPCLLDPQNTCVNISATCDGVRDCPNGIDESNLFCRAFRCDSGSDCYIPFDFVCNGFEDCPNGSDEQDCTEMLMFPAGTSPGATISFNTTVTDDSVANGNRLITTTLTVSPPGQFITGENVTMTTLLVVDDDITTPMISVQPMSLAVLPGDNATFTVAASGGGTLTYRWRFLPSDDDPFDLAGATDATLTITGVTAADVGDYSVTVFNQAGSVVSQPASLSFICPGVDASFPASSCQQILNCNSTLPSGFYWIATVQAAAASRFCDMTRTCGNVTGGWMRVADVDMREARAQCPPGLVEAVHSGQRVCTKGGVGTCSQTFFDTGVAFSQVCGKVIGYQFASPDAFAPGGVNGIDANYLDGVSLTYGSSPRQHIWSFAASLDEVGSVPGRFCPCTNIELAAQGTPPPSFVGNDYFCDTGSELSFMSNTFYGADPLWDGLGCGHLSSCCSLNDPPWFFKKLDSPVTEAIETRVCTDSSAADEQVLVEQIEMYVQ